MIQEQYQEFVLLHNKFYEINHEEIQPILQGKKADEFVPSYLISSSELLSIVKGFISIVEYVPADKIQNRVKILKALDYCKNDLLPDNSKPKASNDFYDMGVPVQNIGQFYRTIKDVAQVLNNYFEENIPVPPKNPIGFTTA